MGFCVAVLMKAPPFNKNVLFTQPPARGTKLLVPTPKGRVVPWPALRAIQAEKQLSVSELEKLRLSQALVMERWRNMSERSLLYQHQSWGTCPKHRYSPVLLHRIVFLQHRYQLLNSTASPILQGRRQASNEVSGSKAFPFWKSALVSGKDNGHAMSGRDRSLQLLLCALQNFKPLLRIFPLSLCLLLLPIVGCKSQVRPDARKAKLFPVCLFADVRNC